MQPTGHMVPRRGHKRKGPWEGAGGEVVVTWCPAGGISERSGVSVLLTLAGHMVPRRGHKRKCEKV